MLNMEDFYNDLAGSYDAMTAFDSRISGERAVLAPFVLDYGIRQAVDMGCGSGVHTFALSGLGVNVHGVDLSEAMLERARMHAVELGLPAQFLTGDMRTAQPVGVHGCDAVLCLGNTLPHLEDEEDLISTLASWRTMLRPGGVLLLQTVNYDRVLRDRERILGVRMTEDGCIVRFYDFTVPRIGFNVLVISRREAGTDQRLLSTGLRPFSCEELMHGVNEAGFHDAMAFADLKRTQWTEDSAAVVIAAVC